MTEQETAIAFAQTTRNDALEEAATVCDEHAAFLKHEAHAGGAWDYLMRRHEEAVHLAAMIRKLAVRSAKRAD
jgi:hypothetical protein